MIQKYWIHPKENKNLLMALMEELAGQSSNIAFEGDSDKLENDQRQL